MTPLRNKQGRFIHSPDYIKNSGVDVVCSFCGLKFKVGRYRLRNVSSICCSRSCASKRRGTAHLRGTITPEVAKRISQTLKGKFTGENSSRWKGGIYRHADRYVYIYSPSHPNKNKDGYVFEHRLVVEKKLNRFLSAEDHVHHINGIKDDNHIDNLIVMSNSDHLKHEWRNSDNNGFKLSKKTWFKKGQIPWNKQKRKELAKEATL